MRNAPKLENSRAKNIGTLVGYEEAEGKEEEGRVTVRPVKQARAKRPM